MSGRGFGVRLLLVSTLQVVGSTLGGHLWPHFVLFGRFGSAAAAVAAAVAAPPSPQAAPVRLSDAVVSALLAGHVDRARYSEAELRERLRSQRRRRERRSRPTHPAGAARKARLALGPEAADLTFAESDVRAMLARLDPAMELLAAPKLEAFKEEVIHGRGPDNRNRGGGGGEGGGSSSSVAFFSPAGTKPAAAAATDGGALHVRSSRGWSRDWEPWWSLSPDLLPPGFDQVRVSDFNGRTVSEFRAEFRAEFRGAWEHRLAGKPHGFSFPSSSSSTSTSASKGDGGGSASGGGAFVSGCPNPRCSGGLVVDLRGNGGGQVNAAVALAGLFLPPDTTVAWLEDGSGTSFALTTRPVSSRGFMGRLPRPRSAARSAARSAVELECLQNLPLVVVTDRGTGSAAELFAAALQDHGRAVVVGCRGDFSESPAARFADRAKGGVQAATKGAHEAARARRRAELWRLVSPLEPSPAWIRLAAAKALALESPWAQAAGRAGRAAGQAAKDAAAEVRDYQERCARAAAAPAAASAGAASNTGDYQRTGGGGGVGSLSPARAARHMRQRFWLRTLGKGTVQTPVDLGLCLVGSGPGLAAGSSRATAHWVRFSPGPAAGPAARPAAAAGVERMALLVTTHRFFAPVTGAPIAGVGVVPDCGLTQKAVVARHKHLALSSQSSGFS